MKKSEILKLSIFASNNMNDIRPHILKRLDDGGFFNKYFSVWYDTSESQLYVGNNEFVNIYAFTEDNLTYTGKVVKIPDQNMDLILVDLDSKSTFTFEFDEDDFLSGFSFKSMDYLIKNVWDLFFQEILANAVIEQNPGMNIQIIRK